jgi:hypothetical protein
MRRKKVNSAQDHFASMTILQLRSHLTTQGVEWHQWMKKATLIKLCEENRIKSRAAGAKQTRGGGRGRRGRRSAAQSDTGENMVIDDASGTGNSSDAGEMTGPFPPDQMMFLERLATDVVRAAVNAVREEQVPSSHTSVPGNDRQTNAAAPSMVNAALRNADLSGAEPGTSGIGVPLTTTRITQLATPAATVSTNSGLGRQAPKARLAAPPIANATASLVLPRSDTTTTTTTEESSEGFPKGCRPLPGLEKEGEISCLLGKSGVSVNSLPQQEFVSVSLKRDILSGKDINLASLLIPNFRDSTPREVQIGDESLTIKSTADKRLSRSLTIDEFSIAFNKYQDIMCAAYPNRRKELCNTTPQF